MRIISPFKDYYDSVQGLNAGREGAPYVRKEAVAGKEVVRKFGQELIPVFNRQGRGYNALCYPFCVLFCGRLYRGVRVDVTGGYEHIGESPCWFNTLGLTGYLRRFEMELKVENRYRWRAVKAETFLDNNGSRQHWQWAIESRTIVLVADMKNVFDEKSYVRYDCPLKPYQFYKQFDPYQAYQEIAMFVDGVLPGKDNAMARISDKDRVAQHGFDKWSFRRLPTKERRKI